ncbi:LexA family protein [Fusobacterium polymorphum]|jgi:repressor LexA|uniref:LexA family protein n=1 Tax=Fusobacterium nucleatum subsp. polymorphum TaxID=76857 RepID=UPI00205D7E12|nr:MAG TPA: Repressor protein CI [Caudoviricetes sp.]
MYSIGKKIAFLRKKEKLNQDELADKLGIARQSILNYENEKRQIPIDVLAKIANFFNVTIESFFSEDAEDFKEVKIEKDSVRIPIYSNASAGTGIYGQEDPLDWLELPKSIAKNATFGTFVKGDSMEPRIYENDLLLIRTNEILDTGSIGVFKLNDDIYCKKFQYNPLTREITLKSLNPKYDPIRITKEDDFCIIGRVVAVIDYTI